MIHLHHVLFQNHYSIIIDSNKLYSMAILPKGFFIWKEIEKEGNRYGIKLK